jgi:hypothetical protein
MSPTRRNILFVNGIASNLGTRPLAVSKAKFLSALGACERNERRSTDRHANARDRMKRIIAGAGLSGIYIWSTTDSSRVSALCLDSTGRFFAVETTKVEPVTVAQGWAFALSCREWADHKDVEDREAACRWEEAILRQLQVAETPAR